MLEVTPMLEVELMSIPQAIQQTLAGDKRAFHLIVQTFRDDLLRIAYSFMGNWDDSLDLTQDTLIRLYQTLESYDSKRSFRNWLLTIHLNNCRSAYKRSSKRIQNTSIDPDQLPNEHSITDVDILIPQINRYLNRLTWSQRSAFQLIAMEEMTSDEAAGIMQCSSVTIRVHLMRAKIKLRRLLIKDGIEP